MGGGSDHEKRRWGSADGESDEKRLSSRYGQERLRKGRGEQNVTRGFIGGERDERRPHFSAHQANGCAGQGGPGVSGSRLVWPRRQ